MRDDERARRIEGPAPRGEDGIAFLTVLMMMAALGLLAVAGSRTTQTEIRIAGTHRSTKEALSVAEAGISHGWALIKASTDRKALLTSGGTGGPLAAMGSAATIDGESYRFVDFGGQTGDGYSVHVEDNFDESAGANDPAIDLDGKLYLIAHGRVGTAQRTLKALLSHLIIIPGFFACNDYTMAGSGSVDSYDSALGYPASARSNGNVGANVDVSFGNNNTIDGDATAGNLVIGGGTLTGTRTENAPLIPCPLEPPCGPPWSDGTGMLGAGYDPVTGNIDTPAHGVLELTGGSYCFNTIVLDAHSQLRVTGPSTVRLVGNADFTGGSVVNTSAIPGDLVLRSTGALIDFSGNAAAAMVIDAPATTVNLYSNMHIFGSIFSRDINRGGGGSLHYDEALGLTGTPEFAASREIRN